MASTSRSKFVSLFGSARAAVIGMVHVQALPGTYYTIILSSSSIASQGLALSLDLLGPV